MNDRETNLDARLRDAYYDLQYAAAAVVGMRQALRNHDALGLDTNGKRLVSRIERAAAAFEAANRAYLEIKAAAAPAPAEAAQ